MATDPTLPPKGPVAEVLFEELRAQASPAGPAGEVVNSVESKYDQQGGVIEEIQKAYGSETKTVSQYQGTRLVSQESTLPNAKPPRPKFWNCWTYDSSGKLTEYRRGSGDTIQNHETNFKRDQQGRLISFDYRQGAKDELFSRTEFHYALDGRTIDIRESDQTGEVMRSTTQIVDQQGYVVQAVIHERDWQTKKLKPPLKVAFSYDNEGRLIEQNTDAHDSEPAGSENELPPGKVSITYDDVKHTRRTTYTGKEGTLFSTVTYDSTGATTAMSFGTGSETIETKLECTYDSHENWTNCQQVVKAAGVSTVGKIWRRTITYR
jgi:hypothetical protein